MDIKRRTALLSLGVALSLASLKAVASVLTGSVSLFASLADSVLDLFASALNYLAISTSLRPADYEHAYGHGKAESLAGLGQSVVVGGSGVYLIVVAIRRLSEPVPLAHEGLGLMVMAVSIVATFLLVRQMRKVAKQTGSVALAADSLHYATDVLANLSVMVSLGLHRFFGLKLADPIISLVIAAYVLHSAWQILRSSVDELMDRQLPEEEIERLGEVLRGFAPRVVGYHDLRTRKAAGKVFIDMHIDILRETSFVDAHHITENVVEALRKKFTGAVVTAHSDPYPGDETHALPSDHAALFTSTGRNPLP